jgi:hypothetical protein
MSSIKGLRTLVRLKKRRVEQHEAALQAGRQRLQQEQSAHEAAQAQEQTTRAAEQAVRDRLAETTSRQEGFRPNDVITFQILVKEAQGASAEAAKQTQAALGKVQSAQQHLAQCDAVLRRARQQVEATQARLDAAIAEAEKAVEDAQDEEAEETAVARQIAQVRERARVAARVARAVPA